MARKLNRMIQPGETIVFRTAVTPRIMVGLSVKSAFMMAGLAAACAWYLDNFWIFIPLLFLKVPPDLWRHSGQTILTDRRVLHQFGRFRHQILEIPLSDIRELVPDMGCLTLRDRGGQLIDLQDLLLPHDVAQAIIDLTGVPDPRLVSDRLRAWDDFGGHFAAGCGVAMVLLLSLGLHEIVGFGADWRSDPTTGLDYALMLMLIPGLMLALLLGIMVGLLILMLAMRMFLCAEEVRTFFDEQPCDAENWKWLAFVDELPDWLARRFASLLYDERI